MQALSSLYVERREGADLAARASAGQGKRAALASYYAPLHFLAAHHAVDALGVERFGAVSRIHDLGCGTGAVGAALGQALGARPEVVGVDRSGFALGEARATYAAFGLLGRTRRGRIESGSPARADELVALGWVVNELDGAGRDALLELVCAGLEAGARLLLLEPLAGAASPWWRGWCEALAPHGVEPGQLKRRIAPPEWIARLDRAAGLDHRVLGARLLAGPLDPAPPET
ncbi:MAG: class I SAM-dependent methyltransferase [Myxococcota bacterium]|nr:class I SAM-dependent methyltransferase [Myxococcota bacterium]